jgi:hypothetical protein
MKEVNNMNFQTRLFLYFHGDEIVEIIKKEYDGKMELTPLVERLKQLSMDAVLSEKGINKNLTSLVQEEILKNIYFDSSREEITEGIDFELFAKIIIGILIMRR